MDEIELLLELDGARFEMAPGVIVEFSARRVDPTPQRPDGVVYAFVMRPKAGGAPWVRFDNSHGGSERRPGYRQRQVAYDHWHRTPYDRLTKQRHRIAGLKRALTLGPDGLRAAASKAKASRKLTRLQAG